MRSVVVAPDKFKGTLSAAEAAAAMAEGVHRALPHARVQALPMSDGGEGFTDALLASLGGNRKEVEVTGPLGDPVAAAYGELPDGRFVLETASASGLSLLPQGTTDPLGATSRGTGELIAEVAARHPGAQILCGLGGSAYNDAGTGAAAALGWRLLDAGGRLLDHDVSALVDLARIQRGGSSEALHGASVTGAYDVDNPLVGERGAARVFGPQKGATPEQVELIARAHEVLAARIEADLGLSVANETAAGASGGLGAGLIAFFGAALTPGFDLVAEAAGLAGAIARADMVLTGEGSLDGSSLGGKTPAGVGRLAAAAGVECTAFAGVVDVKTTDLEEAGIAHSVSLSEHYGSERAMSDAAFVLTEAVAAALA